MFNTLHLSRILRIELCCFAQSLYTYGLLELLALSKILAVHVIEGCNTGIVIAPLILSIETPQLLVYFATTPYHRSEVCMLKSFAK